MTHTYTIQGFDLHQPDIGFQLMQDTAYAPSVNPRRVDLEIPGLHGQVALFNDELSAQKLVLRVRMTDPDPDQLQVKWEHLRALMWTGSNQGLTIRRVAGSQVTATSAQLESMTQPDFWCASGIVDTTMIMNIPSGRWQGLDLFEVDLTTPLGPGNSESVDFVDESTGPNTNALVRIEGPLDNWFEVNDLTSQTGFRVTMGSSLLAGEYIYVDPENYRMWQSDFDDDWDTTTLVIPNAVLTTTLQGPLSLISVPTFEFGLRTSQINTRTSGATIGVTQITLRGRRTYI